MRRLLLHNIDASIWNMLGEYAYLYGDNGDNSDGPAWLPSGQDTIPQEIVDLIVGNGYGEMVEVRVASDEAMVNYLAQFDANAVLGLHVRLANDEFDEEDTDRLKQAADDAGLQWAHFGAYGVMDSKWVFVAPQKDK